MNSHDVYSEQSKRPSNAQNEYPEHHHGEKPPMSPYPGTPSTFQSPYPRYASRYNSPRPLHSVVTTSFSTEEREEHNDGRPRYGVQTYGRREPEGSMYPPLPAKVPMSPSQGYAQSYGPHSASAHRSPSQKPYYHEPMKRNFYHHAQPGDAYTSPVSPDFSPPKRSKTENPPHLRIMKPSNNGRAASWDAGPSYQPRMSLHHPDSSMHGSWDRSMSNRNDSMIERSPSWNTYGHPQHPQQMPPAYRYSWDMRDPGHTIREQGRDDSNVDRAPYAERRENNDLHADLRHEFEPPRPPQESSRAPDRMHLVAQAAAAAKSRDTEFDESREKTISYSSGSGDMTLLSMPGDKGSLSETLCLVRENIEVFTATRSDVDAPAPGRKHAVTVGQVGLRCIYCRHTTRSSDRVKRAVCYPSSIKRIYRTVIDMKLDHFSLCKFVPKELKARLEELKSVQTRSTGTTMQYFIKAAHSLGMVDCQSGVRLREGAEGFAPKAAPSLMDLTVPASKPNDINRNDSMMSTSSGSAMSTTSMSSNVKLETDAEFDPSLYFEGCVKLAIKDDKTSLSPLRCFLREQVCAFTASDEDIAVRAPTTFSISKSQVGIGCIHCVSLPSQKRSNRAVCFPFSISRIYQAVADIQRFHFNECQNLPQDVREKFQSLQSASSKGSKGLATRQYWMTSAKKLGLVDTSRGIRFGRDPSKPDSTPALSLDILAQVAFSVTTASKQLVVPEDKETIAGFLYLVMEQLQPCRFTEADRNKRRLKHVGCIGVECKHCSGQVDSRKFFWSSVNAVESNFVSVHTHMLECKSIPPAIKDELSRLKQLRKEETANLPSGSQKAFFARVWERLHSEDTSAPTKNDEKSHAEDVEPPVPTQSSTAGSLPTVPESPSSSANTDKAEVEGTNTADIAMTAV